MANTPEADHRQIQEWLARSGRTYVEFSFDGDSDGTQLQPMNELPAEIREAGIRLTEGIVTAEIGVDWAEGAGSTGFVRFMPGQPPYLDADAQEKDWTYEREVGIEDIEYEAYPSGGLEP
ncbi:hypothetical protein [Paracoccus sp. ME4]|uniref:hypothetical protein n=1 Tax=Paracoccus sp. ME4 TaxID=3138066 RepID=UPI00398AB659